MAAPAGRASDEGNVVRPLACQPDDAGLVAAVGRGDAAARRLLFERHSPHVARVLARLLGSDGDLADLLHDVFVMALRDLARLHDPSALKAWLTSVAVHVARGHIRKKSRRRWLRFLSPDKLPDSHAPTADGDVRDAMHRMYAVLETLPEDERIAFAFRFIDSMELTDAAEACGVSLAT